MPGLSIPTIIQSIAPALLPSGVPFGPGGVKQQSAAQWNPAWTGEQAAVDLPPEGLSEFLDSQEINRQRNSARSEAIELSNSININQEVNTILERNKKTLGLSGGPNGFYDVSLVRPASGLNSYADNMVGPGFEAEPDGFRLYLMIPPSPAKSVALATDAIGITADKIGDALNFLGVGDLVEGGTALAGEAIGALGSPGLAEFVTKNGKSASELGSIIKKKMEDAKVGFEEKFNQYVKKAYDEHPDGNTFYSIVLPMPDNLVDVHGHQTDDLMLGILPRLLTGISVAAGSTSGSNTRRNKASTATNAPSTALGSIGSSIGFGLGALAAEAGAFAFDNARIRLGVGLNPNVETVYSAPLPRQFQFNFTLYPKSKEEVAIIKDFINRVKQHSYPLSVLGIGGQNQLYLYPGEVYFEFSGKFRNNLFRSLRPCIIKGININYKNSEGYQHFEDGSTVVYIITLELLENRLLDRNILVDDAEKYSNDTFANNQFRKDIKFRDTAWGEGFERLVTDPAGWANDEVMSLFGNTTSQQNTPPSPR